jgi:hypothetical protein
LIQEQLDLVELLLRDRGQVGSSREVLPQQQICIFVTACNNPPPCDADRLFNCIAIEEPATPLCAPVPNAQSSANFQWVAHNRHSSTTIVPRVAETVTHENQFGVPSPQTQNRWIPAISAGNYFPLGCRFVQVLGDNTHDVWHYASVKGCAFGGQVCIQGQEKQIPPSPSAANCLTQTQCAGPDCINYSFNLTGTPQEAQAENQTGKLSQQLLTHAGLYSFSLSGLLGLGNMCPSRDDMLISTGGAFSETGNECEAYILFKSSTPTFGLLLTLPSHLAVRFTQTHGAHQHAVLDFADPYQAPHLGWFQDNKNLGDETVSKIDIQFESSSARFPIKIVGSRHYCIWIRAKAAKVGLPSLPPFCNP